MPGMDRMTGDVLDGEAHLRQSIADILTTPVGSRLARRDYGSLLPDLIDQPVNAATNLRLYAATAVAITRWEPRIALKRIAIAAGAKPGATQLTLEGQRTDLPVATRTRLSVQLNPLIA